MISNESWVHKEQKLYWSLQDIFNPFSSKKIN